MSRSRLEELAALARLVFEVELAALRARQDAVARTEARLADLDAAATRQAQIVAEALEAPVAGAVHGRWGAWAEVQRMELNRRLAQQRAEADACLQSARDAFGRCDAIRGALAAEVSRARQAARARCRRGG